VSTDPQLIEKSVTLWACTWTRRTRRKGRGVLDDFMSWSAAKLVESDVSITLDRKTVGLCRHHQ
jgi:hypothetical protein